VLTSTENLSSHVHTQDQRADSTTLIRSGKIYIQNKRAVCLEKPSPSEPSRPSSPERRGPPLSDNWAHLQPKSFISCNASPLEGSHRSECCWWQAVFSLTSRSPAHSARCVAVFLRVYLTLNLIYSCTTKGIQRVYNRHLKIHPKSK